jgi:hypothetical protein
MALKKKCGSEFNRDLIQEPFFYFYPSEVEEPVDNSFFCFLYGKSLLRNLNRLYQAITCLESNIDIAKGWKNM